MLTTVSSKVVPNRTKRIAEALASLRKASWRTASPSLVNEGVGRKVAARRGLALGGQAMERASEEVLSERGSDLEVEARTVRRHRRGPRMGASWGGCQAGQGL
eukprot:263603-Pyramimonas_sp.AAC.1